MEKECSTCRYEAILPLAPQCETCKFYDGDYSRWEPKSITFNREDSVNAEVGEEGNADPVSYMQFIESQDEKLTYHRSDFLNSS